MSRPAQQRLTYLIDFSTTFFLRILSGLNWILSLPEFVSPGFCLVRILSHPDFVIRILSVQILRFRIIFKRDILFCCQKKCFCYNIYSLCSKKYSFCSVVEHRIFHYIMQMFQYKHKCSKSLFVLFHKKMGLFQCGTSNVPI